MVVTRKGNSSGGRAAQQVGLQGGYSAPSAGSAVGMVGGTQGAQPVGLQGSDLAPLAGIAVALSGTRVAQPVGLRRSAWLPSWVTEWRGVGVYRS